MKPKLLTTLSGYNLKLFWGDLFAGVTVAMVALPLSIAIAIASGADPAKGLVTAIVAGFLISLLGGSRVQIGGPTGAFIVVVYGVVADYGYDGLVLATLMAGAILVVAGLLRAGRLIHHIPESVIDGFTIGIAIVIAASQLKDLLGLSIEELPADFVDKIAALWSVRETASLAAFAVGAAAIVLIFAFRRFAPRVPGVVIAVTLLSLGAALMMLPVDTIASRYGALPDQLPTPALPEVTAGRMLELLPSALVIAFLAGVESLLSAIIADRMIGSAHRSNAELLAQGAANIGSALFGGMPATGAIARTATNVRAGGKTPVAGIVHAFVILVVMMAAAPLAGYLVMPALAGLLIVTAWTMSEPYKWRHHLKARPSDKFLLVLTLVMTVLTDLTVAISVGTALGLGLRLIRRNVPEAEWIPPER